jgi:hypothetical protein
MDMHPVYRALDPFLILFYRLTGHAGVDMVIGTMVLALIALLIGKITVFLVYRLTRKRVDLYAEEAVKYQQMSVDALKAGDKAAYDAANELAKEAFGHSFFQQSALSAGFMWPVFFALAWMQYRFLDVEFPIPGTKWSLGFIGAFIIIYVATYLLLKRLPRFRRTMGITESSLTGTN